MPASAHQLSSHRDLLVRIGLGAQSSNVRISTNAGVGGKAKVMGSSNELPVDVSINRNLNNIMKAILLLNS